MKKTQTCALMVTLLAASSGVLAQSPTAESAGPWSVHVGPVSVHFHPKAEVSLGGAVIPGAGVEASSNVTLGLEVAYAVNPNLAGRLTIGVPPTTKLTGTGPLAGAGELGQIKYGPAVLSLTWAFDGLGPVRPYVGGGVNYTMVLETKDGAITSLDAKSAFGSVLQAGVDVPIDPRWGLFLDVKKIFVKTSATGLVGAAPASASVPLDPLLVHAGIQYRF
jgi:outer membrane protein